MYINWCIYLAQSIARFCSIFHRLSPAIDDFYEVLIALCLQKFFIVSVELHLEGWKSFFFFKKTCTYFLSIFCKLYVKTYRIILGIIRRHHWTRLSPGMKKRGGVSTPPPYQLSLPSPTLIVEFPINICVQGKIALSLQNVLWNVRPPLLWPFGSLSGRYTVKSLNFTSMFHTVKNIHLIVTRSDLKCYK